MQYLVTCQAWLESLVKKEIQRNWGEIVKVYDRLVFCQWWKDLAYLLNLNLRFANRIYLVLGEWKTLNFDDIFWLVASVEYKKIFKKDLKYIVWATSIRSDLTSVPAIQKTMKKAIVKSIKWNKDDYLEEGDISVSIHNFIVENTSHICFNLSWEPLHKRWYRQDSWEAPMKENLASALVSLSNWRFKEPFYDIFCWSWTLAIEACMLAKNIAPWLNRKFEFHKTLIFNRNKLEETKSALREKEFDWNYKIIASDIDEEVLEMAKENAKKAGVYDYIEFKKCDFEDYLSQKVSWYLVSNPPYDERLEVEDIDKMYGDIASIFNKNENLKWWIYTSDVDFEYKIKNKKIKRRKLYNSNLICYFYKID